MTPSAPSASTLPLPRVGAVIIVKNEAPYLLEWIAHHRLMGVTRFFVADNVSTDGTSELLAGLQRLGLVDVLKYPTTPGIKPQLPAYRAMCETMVRDVDWLAFIDADEFLWPTGNFPTLPQYLAHAGRDPALGAIGLNWAVFGSDGALRFDPLEVTRRFQRRGEPGFSENHHIKSLARVSAIHDFLNPHRVSLRPGFTYARSDLKPLVERRDGVTEQVIWDLFRVNHYVVKSWSEYMEKKRPRGNADGPDEGYTVAFFHYHDRGEVPDPMPAEHTRRLLAEIGAIEAQLLALGLSPDTWRKPPASTALPLAPGLLQGSIESLEMSAAGLTCRGWGVSRQRTPLQAVRLVLNGGPAVLPAWRPLPRPDVQALFPSLLGDAGFEVQLPWDELPDDLTSLEAVGVDAAGLEEPLPLGLHARLDSVADTVRQRCQVHGHVDGLSWSPEGLVVEGWGLSWHRDALSGVVLVDGDTERLPVAYARLSRPDVASAFAGADSGCGFRATFDVQRSRPAAGPLRLVGLTPEGRPGTLVDNLATRETNTP